MGFVAAEGLWNDVSWELGVYCRGWVEAGRLMEDPGGPGMSEAVPWGVKRKGGRSLRVGRGYGRPTFGVDNLMNPGHDYLPYPMRTGRGRERGIKSGGGGRVKAKRRAASNRIYSPFEEEGSQHVRPYEWFCETLQGNLATKDLFVAEDSAVKAHSPLPELRAIVVLLRRVQENNERGLEAERWAEEGETDSM
ncbi:hypothetical protein C8R41DRAFT_866318 [Lentinula lateritia]|uniref:Uncharacterized protein n=1 Tax=Lentinula lateritia TaxID=40482 RepID=A0ABQ8VIP5_9AGAR|nr:hypothetical protein C8R41DRAFT_866318 [Lentinula lateritia]